MTNTSEILSAIYDPESSCHWARFCAGVRTTLRAAVAFDVDFCVDPNVSLGVGFGFTKIVAKCRKILPQTVIDDLPGNCVVIEFDGVNFVDRNRRVILGGEKVYFGHNRLIHVRWPKLEAGIVTFVPATREYRIAASG
jgi:hypothetical protein